MLDFSRARLAPFAHQREDTETFINLPYLLIASEMRTGKTKIVIDGTQFLFEDNTIDRVIVVAPSPVRSVWYDDWFGELKKHLWLDTPATVFEHHARPRYWLHGPKTSPKERRLEFIITNYEFIRKTARLRQLLMYCGPRTQLVGDESIYLKNWKSLQTKAFLQMRRACHRVTLINGTPIGQSPEDLFSQANILHPSILQCQFITHFRSRYAKQEPVRGKGGKALVDPRGNVIKKTVGWVHLDDLQRRLAPYTIRRLQKDCLDLPPKLEPVTLVATLTDETWRRYREMRDDALVMFERMGSSSLAAHAMTKIIRLAQITSGFIGGVEAVDLDDDERPEWMEFPEMREREERPANGLVEISREKLDVLIWFYRQRLEQQPNFHMVAWHRFYPELVRNIREMRKEFPEVTFGEMHGKQTDKAGKEARRQTQALLHPDTAPRDKPVFVGGTFGTGSFGLNFTAAHTSMNVSYDYKVVPYLQARDRVYGPGQTEPVAYFDIVAEGPKGQKTVDHLIVKARQERQEIKKLLIGRLRLGSKRCVI
jgi:hypothetical protein